MKKLKLYGYSSSGEERLLELREVTLLADSKQVSPHYSRLMVSGAVAVMLEKPTTPLPLSRSLMAAAGPYVLCWE